MPRALNTLVMVLMMGLQHSFVTMTPEIDKHMSAIEQTIANIYNKMGTPKRRSRGFLIIVLSLLLVQMLAL